MSLGQRLDRLRATNRVEPGALSGRLREATTVRVQAGASDGALDIARLADALSGHVVADGLIECRSQHELPVPAAPRRGLHELPACPGPDVADWCYLDTETTGLAGGCGTLAFMVGIARWRKPGHVELRQWVLASFAAEPAMLDAVTAELAGSPVVVSYNGRAFDMPLLQTRTRMHRVETGPAQISGMAQLDLMHAVRRLYRDAWPDCRLQTAERRLLGLTRIDDLPGAEAPYAWRQWIGAGQVEPLRRVLDHNAQDIRSLALLHRRLPDLYAGHGLPPESVPVVARAWLRSGQPERAYRLLCEARASLSRDGQLMLAALCRRRGEWASAESIWLDLFRQGDRDAALALSKYNEHRRHDYGLAMAFARAAGDTACEHRITRLARKGMLPMQLCLPV